MPTSDDSLGEASMMRRAAGGRSKHRVNRRSSGVRTQRRTADHTNRSHIRMMRKRWAKSSGGRKSKRMAKSLRAGVEMEHEDTVVSEMLDKVDAILGNLDAEITLESRGEATRAFANVALIADHLESAYAEIEVGSDGLVEGFGILAAQAAAIAERLAEGTDPDVDLLNIRFTEMVDGVMDGVGTLIDLVESEDPDADESREIQESDFDFFEFTESEVDAGMRKHGKGYKRGMVRDALGNDEAGYEG